MTVNLKENLPLNLEQDERTYITKQQYIAGITNQISKKYSHLRQDSKAP